MSFVKFLQGIGDRLGILETVPDTEGQAPARIHTRSVSLRELTGEIRSGAVESLADTPAELAVPFEKIFEAAGVSTNPKDWTIERLKQVIEDDSLRHKPRDEVQKTVLTLLNSEGVAADVIVKDAMVRDQALDAYEAVVREKMQSRMEACENYLLTLDARIRDLQAERESLKNSMKDDAEKWDSWTKNKRAKERDLAYVVSFIIDHKVITTEDED